MSITIFRDVPGATADFYDAVVAGLGLDWEPASGLIMHVAGQQDGVWREIFVWESRESWDAFEHDRIGPAVVALIGAEAAAAASPSSTQIMETHNLLT